jgi:two-component system, NarL family, sensor histidine kinase UhpB
VLTLEKARGENRALTQQSLHIQEEERRFLALELHDELGQSLSAIKIMAASLRKASDADAIGKTVDSIMTICDRLFGVVRAMMRRLRPLMLDDLGLAASLDDLIENWRSRNPAIKLLFSYDEAVEDHAGSAKIHLFRIVQECLTNAVKYAQAHTIQIHLRLQRGNPDWIELRIRDDGRGFDTDQPRSGFGLPGMRERVESLGGQFNLDSRPGAGVDILALVPCGATTA